MKEFFQLFEKFSSAEIILAHKARRKITRGFLITNSFRRFISNHFEMGNFLRLFNASFEKLEEISRRILSFQLLTQFCFRYVLRTRFVTRMKLDMKRQAIESTHFWNSYAYTYRTLNVMQNEKIQLTKLNLL